MTSSAVTAASLPSLIGRDDIIKTLLNHIDDGIILVSGTGGAGLGMTTLARRLGAEAVSAYPGGCIEINLQGEALGYRAPLDPAEVQHRILLALNPEEAVPEDARKLRTRYRAVLSKVKALIILDNAASAAQVRYLLPRTNSTVIITSETDLGTAFPKLFSWRLQGLQSEDVHRLLIQAAPQNRHLTRRMAHRLAARLHGVPLALRIVAPLLTPPAAMSPRQLIRHLDAVAPRVVALRGRRTPHTAVDIALEAVYECLADDLKSHFEALAIFSAPFGVEAAAAVWDTTTDEAQNILARLQQHAFVNRGIGQKFYEVHDLIRFFAQDLLLGQPERARGIVTNYVSHIIQEGLRMSAQIRSSDHVHAPPALSYDLLWEHLPTAWRLLTGDDPGWPQPEGMDHWICDMPLRVMPLLNHMLSRLTLRAWLNRSLETAERLGDRRTMGLLLGALGQIAGSLGDDTTALEIYQRQLDIAREREDRFAEAEILMSLGNISGRIGDTRQAGTHWRKALVLFDLIGDERADQLRNWLAELQAQVVA